MGGGNIKVSPIFFSTRPIQLGFNKLITQRLKRVTNYPNFSYFFMTSKKNDNMEVDDGKVGRNEVKEIWKSHLSLKY